MVRIVQANDQSIKDAAALLRDGKLVAIPTETVYGLATNALDGVAVARIFEAKDRPQFNPLIVHTHNLESLKSLVVFSADALRIADHFWPGPLTIILPRSANCPVSELCSAGLPTLAVRVPSHPVAAKLLAAANIPVAAPSANRSGSLSPTAPAHVVESLGDRVDMILAAGSTQFGLESTVLDMSSENPVVLRPGAITAEDIAAILGRPVTYDLGDHGQDVKSPGQLLKHYAPSVPVRLNAVDVDAGEALLAFGSLKFMGLRQGGFASELPDDSLRNLSDEGDLYQAAANLFRMLRELDNPQHKAIAVMSIPNQGVGIAINDRLKRAAASSL